MTHGDTLRRPQVGVGCIVVRDGRWLLVRSRRGSWSTPGGHLDFGESPDACAARETLEETGLSVTNVEFVAITSDLVGDPPRHYVTIWMKADSGEGEPLAADTAEIDAIGWFEPDAFPSPLFPYLENLLAGRSWPARPANLPPAGTRSRHDPASG